MKYVLIDHKINKVEKYSKLIGEYKINATESLYIYIVFTKNLYRFIHNNYNKYLFKSVDGVIVFLSKLKENINDR